MQNLNQQYIQNNSFVTKGQEQHNKNLKEEFQKDVAEYVKNNPRVHKIFLNHSQEYKEFEDISEEEQEKESEWSEQFSI